MHGTSLKMADYACQDPRSVPAMLRGRGDGREKKYLRFVKDLQRRDPTRSLPAIDAAYRRRCEIEAWYEELGPRWVAWPIICCLIWWQMRPACFFAQRHSPGSTSHD